MTTPVLKMRVALVLVAMCLAGSCPRSSARSQARGEMKMEMTQAPSVDEPEDFLSGPRGWRMTDRFRGLRFELAMADASTTEVMESTAVVAKQLHCFGWTQAVEHGVAVVGEARCPKTNADAIVDHLRGHGRLHVKEYADAKIRYHFPSFRVLTETRYQGKTCFDSPPHACARAGESTVQRKDEL